MNLHLILTFVDELNRVEVQAATSDSELRLHHMGALQGRKQLEDLMENAGVDHYLIFSGDVIDNTLRAEAVERTPKQIAEGLERWFRRADEREMKIVDGQTLTDVERSFILPLSLRVCSSSTPTAEGLQSFRAWFLKRT